MNHTTVVRRLFMLAVALMLAVMPTAGKSKARHTFEVGSKTFLLDGKPFVVKAAEVHYTRIPRPYWEHRIKMCKALGMNTLCIYLFWNIHEQQEGVFDFTGNNDVAAFCRLAQKEGMYVIVRPGPYVCAEWEMGGLPWWLLQKPGIRLRESDPAFLASVRRFDEAVAGQLRPLTIAQGGPIIMMQVENEYGSYGEDKAYVSQIRDMLREVGFDDLTLFQCDWSSNFTKNGLDDLLWTMNFGTGANVMGQFKRLQELRPESPLMCSEYWSGWFDGWGRGHETREASAMIAGLKEMLDHNISFSLYMTHGGTSFGPWAGANSPGYKPDCTSYDYDAPISESGRATEKYDRLRELLAQYREGEPLPEVPKPNPVIQIPAISFAERAAVFDNLPATQFSDSIFPMEHFGMGYGTILYTTTLPAIAQQSSLKLTEVHDYARIYLNRKYVGALYRGNQESTLLLPPVSAGSRLDILVEGMGRINFGRAIKDFKGITRQVELTTQEAGVPHTEVLTSWQVATLPADYAFAAQKQFAPFTMSHLHTADPYDNAGYYRATFTLSQVGDTHLDMQHWGKGMVWVNGYCLGRFWRVGPQQTLYMPGCWLRKGRNEIIVLDLCGPDSAVVEGLAAPVHDRLRLDRPELHRQKGDTLRLDSSLAIAAGAFRAGNGWQEVCFDHPEQGRYLCLEALDNHAGNEYAAIAELYALDAAGDRISREAWTVYYADSEENKSSRSTADHVFDLQESTFWSTTRGAAFPHQIVIDLGSEQTLSGLQYLPRMEATVPGAIRDYRIYLSGRPFVKR